MELIHIIIMTSSRKEKEAKKKLLAEQSSGDQGLFLSLQYGASAIYASLYDCVYLVALGHRVYISLLILF